MKNFNFEIDWTNPNTGKNKVYAIECNVWQRYGKNRLYINADKKTYGFYDLDTQRFDGLNEASISDKWLAALKDGIMKGIDAQKGVN